MTHNSWNYNFTDWNFRNAYMADNLDLHFTNEYDNLETKATPPGECKGKLTRAMSRLPRLAA